jgi:hypothetical protein
LDETSAVAKDIRDGKDKDAIKVIGEGKPIQIVTAGVKGYVNEDEMKSLAGKPELIKLFSNIQEMTEEKAITDLAKKMCPKKSVEVTPSPPEDKGPKKPNDSPICEFTANTEGIGGVEKDLGNVQSSSDCVRKCIIKVQME